MSYIAITETICKEVYAKMYTLEQIKKKLEDRKLSVVAEQTGLSRVTLHRVMKPETKTVNSRTLEALSLYFESGA